MSHNLFLNASFHQALFQIDRTEAELIQSKGCDHCAGPLHQAHYPRIGFGIKREHAHFYHLRLSFCCGTCRRRTTPVSVRFAGQRRFISSVFLLLCALRLYPSDARCDAIIRRYGVHVSVSTWKRWRAWWQQLPATSSWSFAKIRFGIFSLASPLPRSLLTVFTGETLKKRLVQLLQFLSPLSCRARG